MRRREAEQQAVINGRATLITERRVVRVAWSRGATKQSLRDGRCISARDAQHADATDAGGCGDGNDGVAMSHVLPRERQRCDATSP